MAREIDWDDEERALFAANNRAGITTHSGRLISVTAGLLVTTSTQGQECAHVLAADTKFTIDGKPCGLSDLRTGVPVLVTQKVRHAGVATLIEMHSDDTGQSPLQ